MLEDRQTLTHALCFVYRLMVASAPLLAFALERGADGGLRDYYDKHLEEETGHDAMLLDDLRRLGVKDIPHFHNAAKIAGAQYYFIAHDHPAMLLGYMKALERAELSVSDVDRLSDLHGTKLTALRHHAEHDPHHKRDLEEVIQSLDPELRERVLWNEKQTRLALEAV